MVVSKKIKIKNTQSSNFTYGYLSEGSKNINLKRYMHPYVHYLFTTAKKQKEPTAHQQMDEDGYNRQQNKIQA